MSDVQISAGFRIPRNRTLRVSKKACGQGGVGRFLPTQPGPVYTLGGVPEAPPTSMGYVPPIKTQWGGWALFDEGKREQV